MANRRRNRRRRRGRYSFLLKLLGALVAVAAVVAAITLFFRMDHIVISGNERYSEEEIVKASGLQTGENLYFFNKFDVKESIFASLPYVEELRINRKLPDTVMIEVRECKAAAGVRDGEGVWLISDQGKLLERQDTSPEGCPTIFGETLVEPAANRQIDFGEAAAYRGSVVLTLLRESETLGIRDRIGEIDMSDETALNFSYLGAERFTVRFPWTADVAYKLESLKAVARELEKDNERRPGCIDLMTEEPARFIPD